MGSRRFDSRKRRDRYGGYDTSGWESGGDERRDRSREEYRERRPSDKRGGSADSYDRRGYGEAGARQVRCYECKELGHYKSQCPRLQGRPGNGGQGGMVFLSKELEDSLSVVGRMAKQLLEKQKEVKDAKREAEEKRKKEEEEKAAKEAAARVELEKKKVKEEKIQKRKWEIKTSLAEQREMYETKLEKIVRSGIKRVSIGKKETAVAAQTSSSSEDEDEEVVVTPLVDKRKRRDSTGDVENNPPTETPSKLGKKEDTSTPTSSKRKGRGRPTKTEAQPNRMARGEDPWEGVPMGEKFSTESAYKKAVRKTLGSFYPKTLQLMCKGAAIPFYGVNDAVDILAELRVTFCFRGKAAPGSTSSKEDEIQIRGDKKEDSGEPDE
ncbi:hypothetical protein CBR_g50982 [Chara braunii]|uniref:CCHC-type domain-containing protein n=1 Tax=Chara braunii TaxID=69332 RepID=A0A388M7X7_CHABU|nr:hypothetical protein CBR_g50982 [Chara braunii]|eukprot:GBG90636.1 hypothetical protein CBR_g50982 [Chara braunii]